MAMRGFSNPEPGVNYPLVVELPKKKRRKNSTEDAEEPCFLIGASFQTYKRHSALSMGSSDQDAVLQIAEGESHVSEWDVSIDKTTQYVLLFDGTRFILKPAVAELKTVGRRHGSAGGAGEEEEEEEEEEEVDFTGAFDDVNLPDVSEFDFNVE